MLPAVWPWAASAQSERSNCVLVPSETPGPFPLDLTENTFFFRQDIREDRAGVPLRQKIRIVGADNCDPMPNVRVNIWHCDRDGDYSGYAAMGSEGQNYCRGYQMTDANGECEFLTIFPGWYPGRTTHVHFQVHVSLANGRLGLAQNILRFRGVEGSFYNKVAIAYRSVARTCLAIVQNMVCMQ